MLRTLHRRPLEWRRTIFVTSGPAKPKRSAKAAKEKISRFLELDDRLSKQKEQEYIKKLKELKSLTTSVSRMITERKKQQAIDDLPMPSQKKAAEVYQALESPKQVVDVATQPLVTPVVQLPSIFSSRLGLSVKYLARKDAQNWPLVLHQLREADGFKNVPVEDVRDFIACIPPSHLKPVIPMVEKLLEEGNVPRSPRMVNYFIKALVLGLPTSAEVELVETYIGQIRQLHKGPLPRSTYDLAIEAHGKNGDLEKINAYLEEMKRLGIAPSPRIYNNVLATSVYKTKDHKQAVALFDSMKFLSEQTKPSTRAYQDIIVSYVNNNDIERALDLYQEMLQESIPLNQQILVALARGCTLRRQLRFKAWDFMFEIYNQGWEPTVASFEYILYLAAQDGDVAMARLLYGKLHQASTVSPRSFSFLMLAYSKSPIKRDTVEPLPITMHEQGRVFRRNILKDSTIGTPDGPALPFLPVLDLSLKEQILAELSAMWAHTLMTNPGLVSSDCVNTFLDIAAEMGTLKDFLERFEEFTFLDRTGAPTETIIEEPEQDQDQEKDQEPQVQSPTTAPVLRELPAKKMARTSLSYVIALKAAGRHKNYPVAQRVWTERGTYRKTDAFKALSRAKKDHLDFMFATAMVQCLTKMLLLDDALAILVSTEYQFKWTWNELKGLYEAGAELGKTNVTRVIRGVVKRAQINHEGKIRRKDYKMYTLMRGY